MNRLRDWLFAHVYLPSKKQMAKERVRQLVEEQNRAYERLMTELNRIRKEVEDKTANEHD